MVKYIVWILVLSYCVRLFNPMFKSCYIIEQICQATKV